MLSQPKSRAPVLLVEDDPDSRVLAREVLELAGFVVASASNGQEALDALPAMTRPFVILLDIEMPIMGGWEFLERLRGVPEFREIPVVVVSSTDHRASPEVAFWIKKPASGATLVAAVRSFLPPRAASE